MAGREDRQPAIPAALGAGAGVYAGWKGAKALNGVRRDVVAGNIKAARRGTEQRAARMAASGQGGQVAGLRAKVRQEAFKITAQAQRSAPNGGRVLGTVSPAALPKLSEAPGRALAARVPRLSPWAKGATKVGLAGAAAGWAASKMGWFDKAAGAAELRKAWSLASWLGGSRRMKPPPARRSLYAPEDPGYADTRLAPKAVQPAGAPAQRWKKFNRVGGGSYWRDSWRGDLQEGLRQRGLMKEAPPASEEERWARIGAGSVGGAAAGLVGGSLGALVGEGAGQISEAKLRSPTLTKRSPGTPLSEEERQQRVEAARARWANHIPDADPEPAPAAAAARAKWRPPSQRINQVSRKEYAARNAAAKERWRAIQEAKFNDREARRAKLAAGEEAPPDKGKVYFDPTTRPEQPAEPRPQGRGWTGARLGVGRGVKTATWPGSRAWDVQDGKLVAYETPEKGPGRTYRTWKVTPLKPKDMPDAEYIAIGRKAVAQMEGWKGPIFEDIVRTDSFRDKPVMPADPDPRVVRIAWNHARQMALNNVMLQRVEGDFSFNPRVREQLRGYEGLVRDLTYRLTGRLRHETPETWARFRAEFGQEKADGAVYLKDTKGGFKAGEKRKAGQRHAVLVKRAGGADAAASR
jgi:hypothetical protein